MYPRTVNLPRTHSFFLFGARGTGKTSLLIDHFTAQEALYIDLLLGADYLRFASDSDEFIRTCTGAKKKWIVIDEIQKAPALLDAVHHLIEKEKLFFALTGSSARKLRRGAANLLAGRAFVFELFPLTHRELGTDFDLQSALEWGTLPKIFSLDDAKDKQRFLEAYALTYLKEEISAEQVVRKLDPFARFLEVAAQSNTQIINYSKIADDVRSSAKVVQTYFQILEDTLVGFILPPFHQSIRKRQKSAPKFYFFDTGVSRALARNLGQPLQPGSYAYGKFFEHFVICELKRLASYYETNFSFSYLRTKDDAEIDLIVERPGLPLAVLEIKSSTYITERDVSSLQKFSADFPNAELMCLCQEERPKRLGAVDVEPWRTGIARTLMRP